MTTKVKLAGIALIVALLAACGQGGVKLQEDTQLATKIQELQRNGGQASLLQLTGGDWDTVHVFPEPVSREYVEKAVGTSIEMGEFFSTRGHILVFMKDGAVQRAVYTTPNNLVAGKYSSKVMLRTRPQAGSPVLDLYEP